MFLMASEKNILFTFWPRFTYTKYENKSDDRAKREKN